MCLFTQADPIGIAGGVNLYGYANGDPINFSDPFGLCPKYAGGSGETETAGDCSEGVLTAWAAKHVTLGAGATWEGVDSALRDAVTMASIQLNQDLYVSATTGGEHSSTSRHYQGLAVDISRVNGNRFGGLPVEVGQGVGSVALSLIPSERWREFIAPGVAFQFNGPMTWDAAARNRLINAHRTHAHIAILGR